MNNAHPVSVPAVKACPPIESPSRSWDLKKLKTRSSWSLPITLTAKTPVSVMWEWAPESPLTPTATKGGAKYV